MNITTLEAWYKIQYSKVSSVLMWAAFTATWGHGDVQVHAAAESHVWFHGGPIAARDCVDFSGPCYQLKTMWMSMVCVVARNHEKEQDPCSHWTVDSQLRKMDIQGFCDNPTPQK